MDIQINKYNEGLVSAAFNKQSGLFDELYAANPIIQYKRNRVRKTLLKLLKPGSKILELNAGTGEDAVFLAEKGLFVHATDISPGMQMQLKEKVNLLKLDEFVSFEICSFTALDDLQNKGPFDCIFSNFAGLNCTGELKKVLQSFDTVLKPGGIVILVILPQFCLWETLLLFKGKFRTATRRFFGSGGRDAQIEGISFTCWYYAPRFIKKTLGEKFKFRGLEGLCTIVPPSYIENFADKNPSLFKFLCMAENRLKTKWPWKYIGDYYIISFSKE
jgi:ubiquinone/menaquinone biosynthesis C-methylase UbiE